MSKNKPYEPDSCVKMLNVIYSTGLHVSFHEERVCKVTVARDQTSQTIEAIVQILFTVYINSVRKSLYSRSADGMNELKLHSKNKPICWQCSRVIEFY